MKVKELIKILKTCDQENEIDISIEFFPIISAKLILSSGLVILEEYGQ